MMFFIFQISVLFLLALAILIFIKNRVLKVLFATLFSLFITLEISSIFLNDNFIDYRYFTHMNLTAILTHGFQFVSYFLISCGVLIGMFIVLIYLSNKIPLKRYYLAIIPVLFLTISAPPKAFLKRFTIYQTYLMQKKWILNKR